jgi:Skp family chaperone for outer membrane proteins
MNSTRRWARLAATLGVLITLPTLAAGAQALRCEDAYGRVTYEQIRCPNGTKLVRTIDEQGKPTPSEEAAAAERARREAKELQRAEQERQKEEARRAKAASEQQKKAQSTVHRCKHLELRVKQAEDDLKTASLNRQAQAESKVSKAKESYALDCGQPK